MSGKSICHISTVHSIYDSRIFYKECLTLVENDFQVNLVINAQNSAIIDGVNIIALSSSKNRFYRVFVSSFLAFSKAWRTHSAIYHFHDPELIFIGFLFKVLGKKVIYDVHEDLREDILLKKWLGGYLVTKLISQVSSLIEKMADIFFDAIITTTPKIASRFNPQKTVILRNFVKLSNFNKSFQLKNRVIDKSDKKVLIYIGLLARIRGIKEIIDAMEIINIDAELWLFGQWESEQFKKECEEHPNFKKVKYFGYIKHDKIPSFLCQADVGMVTLHPTSTFIESYPIKVFEYMSSGLPVIMSDFVLWKELFKGAAIFTNPLDISDIANKIDFILSEEKIRKAIAVRGENLVTSEFNWEMESKKLIRLYNKLLNPLD